MWHFPCCMCHLIVLSSLYTVNNNNRFCGIIYERAPDLCMLNNYHFELEMKHAFIYEVAHTARQTFNNISQFPCILNNQCSSCSLRTLKNISPQHNHLKIISVTQETLFVWNNFLHTEKSCNQCHSLGGMIERFTVKDTAPWRIHISYFLFSPSMW